MAYVVWRVLMKKYSKVRLGVQRGPNSSVSSHLFLSYVKPDHYIATYTQIYVYESALKNTIDYIIYYCNTCFQQFLDGYCLYIYVQWKRMTL